MLNSLSALRLALAALLTLSITCGYAQVPTKDNAPAPDTLSPIKRTSEIPPSFPGGQQGFVRFISKNLRYPDSERQKATRGTVKVDFIVHEDGSCGNFKVVQSLGPAFDEEALRVLALMPNWTSGRSQGKSVKVLTTIPVYFSMNTALDIQKNPNKNRYK